MYIFGYYGKFAGRASHNLQIDKNDPHRNIQTSI